MPSDRTRQPKVGWIGVGKMGNPMAKRLIEAGHGLTVCDPLAENRASLVARGAHVAASARELAARCNVVFSTVPNDTALADMIHDDEARGNFLADLGAGTVLVEMSTVSPEISARLAAYLSRRDVLYLRCPMSGSTDMARAGQLTVLSSGDLAAWQVAEPLLDLIAAHKFYLGEGEEARYMKLVINNLLGATSAVLAEALMLGASGGLSPARMMEVIAQSAVASPLIGYKREMVVRGDYAPAFSLGQMHKDFSLISQAGRDRQVPMFLTNLVLEQFTAARNRGQGERDFFALIDWMRQMSPPEARDIADGAPAP